VRYLIFGSGAVGGYIGGRLALAGHPLVFLDRPPVIQTLAKHGLRLQQGGGEKLLRQPQKSSYYASRHTTARKPLENWEHLMASRRRS